MINLLPYKEKKSIERIRAIRIARTVIVGILFLIIAAGLLLVPIVITIRSRLGIATKQIESLERDGMIASSLDLASLESRAKEVKNTVAIVQKKSPTEFIGVVKAIVPNGIMINRFTTEDSALLEIFGISQNREILQTFITTLSADPAVLLVDNPVSNFIKNKNGTFKLTVSFK